MENNLMQKVLDYFNLDTTDVPEQLYKDVFNSANASSPVAPVSAEEVLNEFLEYDSVTGQLKELTHQQAIKAMRKYLSQSLEENKTTELVPLCDTEVNIADLYADKVANKSTEWIRWQNAKFAFVQGYNSAIAASQLHPVGKDTDV